MVYYVFVPTADLTQAMKNRAIQSVRRTAVTIDSVVYSIVEIEAARIVLTTIFDTYVWYSATQARDIKDTLAFP